MSKIRKQNIVASSVIFLILAFIPSIVCNTSTDYNLGAVNKIRKLSSSKEAEEDSRKIIPLELDSEIGTIIQKEKERSSSNEIDLQTNDLQKNIPEEKDEIRKIRSMDQEEETVKELSSQKLDSELSNIIMEEKEKEKLVLQRNENDSRKIIPGKDKEESRKIIPNNVSMSLSRESYTNVTALKSCGSNEFLFEAIFQIDSQGGGVHNYQITRLDNGNQVKSESFLFGFWEYSKSYCLSNGFYKITINSLLGLGMGITGWFKLKIKGISLYEIEGGTIYSKLEVEFGTCSSDSECDDEDICTKNKCNSNSLCEFIPDFSACRSFGTPSILTLRVIALDAQTTSSTSEIGNMAYGTHGHSFTLKSQFSACSYGKFDIIPFSGITTTGEQISDGIADVTIDMNVVGADTGEVVNEIVNVATARFGDLEAQFGFLIICLPPGTLVGDAGDWKAYAYVNSYQSIYNDDSCIYPSILLHEVGHNLGLSHSNDHENYGDTSGQMGISRSIFDGPVKCFNGPKMWQLGWFKNTHKVIQPSDLSYDIQEFQLIGISDYQDRFKEYTIVRLVNGDDGNDYFFTFNSATNMNSGTEEGANMVLATKRPSGEYYSDSFLIGAVNNDEYYGIINHDAKNSVRFKAVIDAGSSPPTATLRLYLRSTLSDFHNLCTNDNECYDLTDCTTDSCFLGSCRFNEKACADCGEMVSVEVSTNEYPDFILWDIQNTNNGAIVRSSGYYSQSNTYYSESKCLGTGNYKFSISYSGGIGASNISFKVKVGDLVIDEDEIYKENYLDTGFTICMSNDDCQDFDGCTVDYCDTSLRICNNTRLASENECSSCTWLSLSITPDNFPEETAWSIFNYDTDFNVISGDPFALNTVAFGRRKAPTKASGRRKAPTRSSTILSKDLNTYSYPVSMVGEIVSLDRRPKRLYSDTPGIAVLEDNDETVNERICFEHGQMYRFLITDSFGDGMCCVEGNGEYIITVDDVQIKAGGDFPAIEEFYFKFMSCSTNDDCDDGSKCTTDVCYPGIATCVHYQTLCAFCGVFSNVIAVTGLNVIQSLWDITNIGGGTVKGGGPYEEPARQYETQLCLPFGTYVFNIFSAISIFSDNVLECVDNAGNCGITFIVNGETLVSNYNVDESGPLKLNFEVPDTIPSQNPSIFPSLTPSNMPSVVLSNIPSFVASGFPSDIPSTIPSNAPSIHGSSTPSISFSPSEEYDDWTIFLDEDSSSNGISYGSVLNSISLHYFVSKGKTQEQLRAKILDESCSAEYTGTSVIILNKTLLSLSDDNNGINYDKGSVYLNFNETEIKESILWNSTAKNQGILSFCIRTELLFDDETHLSVSFQETQIQINVDFSVAFSVENISLNKKVQEEVYSDADLSVLACICGSNIDAEGIYECDDSSINVGKSQNSLLTICVSPTSSSTSISKFESLVLYQDGIAKLVSIDKEVENIITSVISVGEMGVVETRLITSFFEVPTPAPITIEGTVLLTFSKERRLLDQGVASLSSSKWEEMPRKQAPFQVVVHLKKDHLGYDVSSYLIIISFSCVLLGLLSIQKLRRKRFSYKLLETEEI